MHIDIEQGTQQIAANRGRRFYPEEIDLVLNKVQGRFVASCLKPKPDGSGGFELDQIGGDKIRSLIKRANLSAYVDDTERYKSHLPPDYAYLLSDWSNTIDLCNGTITPSEATHTQFITRLRQERSAEESPMFYETLSLSMPDATVTVPGDLPYGHNYAGYPEVSDIMFLVPWILHKAGILYWEKFDNYNYPSHYIAVKTEAYGGSVAIDVDGDTYTNEVVTTRILTYHNDTGAKRHNNRLSGTDIIPSLNESSYWKSSHYSPISELEGNNLYIYRDNSFIVTGTGISYIRKPQPISLSLNSDCEFADERVQRAICDLAIEYIKGTVQNVEGKQLKSADIAERVII